MNYCAIITLEFAKCIHKYGVHPARRISEIFRLIISQERLASHGRVLFRDLWRRRHLTSARKHHPSAITKISSQSQLLCFAKHLTASPDRCSLVTKPIAFIHANVTAFFFVSVARKYCKRHSIFRTDSDAELGTCPATHTLKNPTRKWILLRLGKLRGQNECFQFREF